ncbi:MAG: hypothetical protein WC876_09485 [Candidatus Thermoplasmatota archaeon]
MSPAKSKKAAKPAKKAVRPAKSAKKSQRAAPAKKAPKTAGTTPTSKAKAAPSHAHCAATDPFGDHCQNLPRRPSKYCVIHSYLER